MTSPRALPDSETLRRLLAYDPESGRLFWREREGSAGHIKSFNRRFSGRPALNYLGANGYHVGHLLGARVLAHRVIWKLVTGEEPEVIDHADGNPLNNRIGNLRSVSQSENTRNAAVRRDNNSGQTGVWWEQRSARWVAEISIRGNKKHLGQFADLEAAISARKRGEKEFGFHPNHGRAA